MEYFSRKYMTFLGKFTAVIMILQLAYIFIMYPIVDAFIVYIASTTALFPLLFRRHEDLLAEYGDSDDWQEYMTKIVLPSFILTIVFCWIAMNFVSVPAALSAFVKPEMFSFVFYLLLLSNVWFLIIYFLNAYLRYRGVDSIFTRVLICLAAGVILGVGVGFLAYVKMVTLIPVINPNALQQMNPNTLPKTTN